MNKLPEISKMEKLIRYEFDKTYSFDLKYRTNYGFIRSLCSKNVVDKIETIKYLTQCYKNIVQIGIGGSALGASASCEFLGGAYYNYTGKKKYFNLDNIDPARLEFLLSHLNLNETLFHIVSKSGSTIETISQFLIIYEKIKTMFRETADEHFVFTTSDKGFLYEFAKEKGITTFFIPQEVGGRYSVFTSVGLLPLSFLGYDIKQFINGAKTAVRAFRNGWSFPNDFACFSIGEYKNGKNMIVIFAYKDRLYGITEWFRQLWSESLGKNGLGQTPISALGVTDQHSQLQLYQEGPKDKVIIFMDIEQRSNFTINNDYGLGYLKNKNLKNIMEIEKHSTEMALRQNGVNCGEIFLKEHTEFVLGALYASLMIATAKAGEILNINPFNQPGVELSKLMTKQSLSNSIIS